jgi:hypothetical protein
MTACSLGSLYEVPSRLVWREKQWVQGKCCYGEINAVGKLLNCIIYICLQNQFSAWNISYTNYFEAWLNHEFLLYICVILHHFLLPYRVNKSYKIKWILSCSSLLPDILCPRHGQIYTTALSIFYKCYMKCNSATKLLKPQLYKTTVMHCVQWCDPVARLHVCNSYLRSITLDMMLSWQWFYFDTQTQNMRKWRTKEMHISWMKFHAMM